MKNYFTRFELEPGGLPDMVCGVNGDEQVGGSSTDLEIFDRR